MIKKTDLQDLLKIIGFAVSSGNVFEKHYPLVDCDIVVDFKHETIEYPVNAGMKIDRHVTDNFAKNENYVVLDLNQ